MHANQREWKEKGVFKKKKRDHVPCQYVKQTPPPTKERTTRPRKEWKIRLKYR